MFKDDRTDKKGNITFSMYQGIVSKKEGLIYQCIYQDGDYEDMCREDLEEILCGSDFKSVFCGTKKLTLYRAGMNHCHHRD